MGLIWASAVFRHLSFTKCLLSCLPKRQGSSLTPDTKEVLVFPILHLSQLCPRSWATVKYPHTYVHTCISSCSVLQPCGVGTAQGHSVIEPQFKHGSASTYSTPHGHLPSESCCGHPPWSPLACQESSSLVDVLWFAVTHSSLHSPSSPLNPGGDTFL